MNNPLRYVDPTGEDWWSPLTWGQDTSGALAIAGAALGDWWASSSWLDKLDMAMTIIEFIPGVDVIRAPWRCEHVNVYVYVDV